jgi:hypothetical protein
MLDALTVRLANLGHNVYLGIPADSCDIIPRTGTSKMEWERMTPFTQRVSHLEPEGAYAVLAKSQALEAKGHEIIHLEIGEPDFNTYPNITLAGIQAISTGKTRYNPPAGIPALRQVLAK